MTVAEMIAQRTVALRKVLNDCAVAVDAKGGTPADDLSGLQDAIVSIPTGGVVLPELTDPAEVGHVVDGKEYIDGAGMKRVGTLVVCDTIEEAESFGEGGVGLQVGLESSADGSNKTLTIPEPNLLPENIKNGVSIFGIAGTAKTLRVETGTITPAEDSLAFELPCTANPNVINVHMTDAAMETILTGSVNAALTAIGTNTEIKIGAANNLKVFFRAIVTVFVGSAAKVVQNSQEITMDAVTLKTSSGYPWKAGCEYQWTAYYWED